MGVEILNLSHLAGVEKGLPEYLAKEPANIGLRSHYSIRLYSWAKKYISNGKKRSRRGDDYGSGNITCPLSDWLFWRSCNSANFRSSSGDPVTTYRSTRPLEWWQHFIDIELLALFGAQLVPALRLCFSEQTVDIERAREHFHFAIGSPRPLFGRAIPVKFDAVVIGIAQIKRFAHPVVRCAIQRNVCAHQAKQGIRKLSARRIENCKVVKPRAAG